MGLLAAMLMTQVFILKYQNIINGNSYKAADLAFTSAVFLEESAFAIISSHVASDFLITFTGRFCYIFINVA